MAEQTKTNKSPEDIIDYFKTAGTFFFTVLFISTIL